jgi:hypothetical protein
MTQYRKKPVVIEAWEAKEIAFNAGNNWAKLPDSIKESYEKGGWVFLTNGEINIPTLEGTMKANKDDMIIQGVNGEFYPCKQDIFEKTYELFKQEEQQKKTDDFKSRLIEEQKQLEEKLNKLNDFNQSDKVNDIDPVQKDLLLVQAGAMYTYNEVLKVRIAQLG